MVKVDVYQTGSSNPLFTADFEAVPRVGEQLRWENDYYSVEFVTHEVRQAGIIHVEIDISSQPTSFSR